MSAVVGAQLAPKPSKSMAGIVVSAGLMRKTVKVRVTRPVFNRRVQKTFAHHVDHLVHDPSSAARLGDVVSIQSGYRASKQVKHLLSAVLTPMGASTEERPSIPTAEELLGQRKAKRAARDEEMMGVADRVERLRVLERGAAKENGAEGGAEMAEEIRRLKGSKDVQAGMAKGINGALMRLREASKYTWRQERAAMTLSSVDACVQKYEEEGKRWQQRSQAWYRELNVPAAKGRSAKWKAELDWRAKTAADMAASCKRRIGEAEAYRVQVESYAKCLGESGSAVSLEDAERSMRGAQDELLRSLCGTLAAGRGVYAAEIMKLQSEDNWLYSDGWLRDPAHPWRWQAHAIQLRESGRLRVDEMVALFHKKGRNSPAWYAAMQNGADGLNEEMAKGTPVAYLKRALLARRDALGLPRRETTVKPWLTETVPEAAQTEAEA